MLLEKFGDPWLDEMTSRDVERGLEAIDAERRPSDVEALPLVPVASAMFRRAMRDGHLTSNPVPDVPQLYGSVAY